MAQSSTVHRLISGTLTLKSISIHVIRSHYVEHTRYLYLNTEKYYMREISVYCFPSVRCKLKLERITVSIGERCREQFRERCRKTDCRPVQQPSRVQLPVAWALCRVDQVTASPTSITPYILFHLLISPASLRSFVSIFWPRKRHLSNSLPSSLHVILTDTSVPPLQLYAQR